ncbi:MAG: DUF4349 domain-containing protein [Clostridiales bacterium]|nr:DUF4349 domain-containing protein [Clostridiales bacterium]
MKYNDIMDDESLSGILRGLDDSVTVPENAASEWRAGVKKRMRFDKRLNSLRWAGEIAAVILVIVCVLASPLGSMFGANTGSENDQTRQVKYAYSDINLMASGLSFIESDSGVLAAGKKTVETEEAQTDAFDTAGDEPLILFSKSDPNAYAIGGDNMVVSAKVSFYTKNVDDSKDKLKLIASSYDTILEDEVYENKDGKSTVSGKLRVRKDEAQEFLGALRAEFAKAEITVESHDFDSSYVDASSRIYDLEDLIASLKNRVDMAEQDEIELLRRQLTDARNELESIKAEADEYLLDKEYMTVTYSFTNVRPSVLLGSTGRTVIYGAGLILVTIALTVLITLHISAAFRKRKLFA